MCGVYERGPVLELGHDTVMNTKSMNDISNLYVEVVAGCVRPKLLYFIGMNGP